MLRLGLFGSYSRELLFSVFVPLELETSRVGSFAGFCFIDLEGEALSDDWLDLALILRSQGYPVFWCVEEHQKWKDLAEASLTSHSVFVSTSELLESNFSEFEERIAKQFEPGSTVLYAIQLSQSDPKEHKIISKLSECSDPEQWIKDQLIKIIQLKGDD